MKRFAIAFSLVVFLLMGCYAMYYSSTLDRTYSGTKLSEILKPEQNYDLEKPDGVANIMIRENLKRTRAVNAVTAIVFDYRGYDTLGESFILLTAIAGSVVILKSHKKGSDHDEGQE